MIAQPCQCMDCSRWFVASGQIVKPPTHAREVSTGLCPDCYLVRVAPFQPVTLAAWVASARTSAQQVLNAFSAPVSPGFNWPLDARGLSPIAGTASNISTPHAGA